VQKLPATEEHIPGHSADETPLATYDKKEMNAEYVHKQISYAQGDRAEAAYWHMKMFTDPTQQATRDSFGLGGPKSEREAFKRVFNLFGLQDELDRIKSVEFPERLAAALKPIRYERNIYKIALDSIANPVLAMQQEAASTGAVLNGAMAVQLASNANYLSNIAKQALQAPMLAPLTGLRKMFRAPFHVSSGRDSILDYDSRVVCVVSDLAMQSVVNEHQHDEDAVIKMLVAALNEYHSYYG
jgi:hypothetical protein